MKKIFISVLIMLLFVNVCFAFMGDIKILTKEELQKLSDKALVDVYISAKIDSKASQTFHNNAGFSSPKEYNEYKALLTYIVTLMQEMESRGIEPPPIDAWLK